MVVSTGEDIDKSIELARRGVLETWHYVFRLQCSEECIAFCVKGTVCNGMKCYLTQQTPHMQQMIISCLPFECHVLTQSVVGTRYPFWWLEVETFRMLFD